MWPFVIYIIMKALNGFLVTQRQVTLKDVRYNVRPRMSDDFLAGSVDATSVSLLVVPYNIRGVQ